MQAGRWRSSLLSKQQRMNMLCRTVFIRSNLEAGKSIVRFLSLSSCPAQPGLSVAAMITLAATVLFSSLFKWPDRPSTSAVTIPKHRKKA